MRKLRVGILFLALFLPESAWAQAARSATVETVRFESKMVGKALPYDVILPPDYDQNKTTRYPVLYLLHGLFGHYDNWVAKTQLTERAGAYQLIIVTPEGNDGWYTDSAVAPADKYESYILQELIPDVQQHYRAIEMRGGRAVAGLSMGGYGALKFGVKHPELFVFVASISGALGPATWTETDLRGLQTIWKSLAPVYGPMDSPVRAANDVYKLYREFPAERLADLPFVYLDCGTEDPFLPGNRSFADILQTRKIPHEYRELPGAHAWTFWNQQVVEVLRIAATKFSPAQTATAR
jgi:putative tributyrin esterase